MVYFAIMMLMAKKTERKTFETEQLNIRLSSALLDRLDRIGEPLGIKRSLLIQQAIVEYVMRNEQPQQPQQQPPKQPPRH